MDANVKWTTVHISERCKISLKIGLLWRLKKTLPVNCVAKIYKATIQPHIDYCITSWGHASNVLVDKVRRLQNCAAKIITGKFDYDVKGIQDLVKQSGWHNVGERRDYFTLVTVYKTLKNLHPTTFKICLCIAMMLI